MTTTLLELALENTQLRRTAAREWAGPCPLCGGEDRFTVTTEAGRDGLGLFWCRGCKAGGDRVDYLRRVRGMSFRDACSFLGRHVEVWPPVRQRSSRKPCAPEVRDIVDPPDLWSVAAEKVVTAAEKTLQAVIGTDARAHLSGRGIDTQTARWHRLGYIPRDMYFNRADWGLEDAAGAVKPTKICVPAGIVIPCCNQSDRVVRIRVRRDHPKGGPRYHTVAGSNTGCLIAGTGDWVFIVESDLDAIMLAAFAGMFVRVVALGSAQVRLDPYAADIVRAARRVFVALDGDEAGDAAATRNWRLPNATRWPVPAEYGKDPGDAHRAGFDLAGWIIQALDTVCAPLTSRTTHEEERT
mgnify:CR=1 FL=1